MSDISEAIDVSNDLLKYLASCDAIDDVNIDRVNRQIEEISQITSSVLKQKENIDARRLYHLQKIHTLIHKRLAKQANRLHGKGIKSADTRIKRVRADVEDRVNELKGTARSTARQTSPHSMEQETFLNKAALPKKSDFKVLFDPEKRGSALFKGVIAEEFSKALVQEVQRLRDQGKMVESKREGQYFFIYTLGDKSEPVEEILKGLPYLSALEKEYRERVYNPAARTVGFPEIPEGQVINSIAVYVWPNGTGRTDWHQDAPFFMNLIGVVTLSGEAEFSVRNTGREGEGSVFNLRAGDLTLTRANLENEEKGADLRPPHKVEVPSKEGGEDRYTVIFRYADKESEEYRRMIRAREEAQRQM